MSDATPYRPAEPRRRRGGYEMLLVADKPGGSRSIVIIARDYRSKWFDLTCFCRRVRKDGSCKKTDAVLSSLVPEIRERTRKVKHV